jgi:hypothetical protein
MRMPVRRMFPVAVALLALGVVSLGCAASAPPQLAALPPPANEREAEVRLHFLEERLDGGRRHAQLWHWGWTAANGFGIGSSAVGLATNDETGPTVYNGLQIGISALGLLDLYVIDPLPGRAGADPIRSGDPATRLARGEALLADAARHADERRDWTQHFANFAIQAIAAAVLLGIDEPGYAAASFGLGMLGGEAYIWSAPAQPARDWRDYRELVTGSGVPSEPKAELHFAPSAQGLALELRY